MLTPGEYKEWLYDHLFRHPSNLWVLWQRVTTKPNLSGNDFFNSFSYQTFDDPTHGRVNYVDSNTAKSQNLTYASGDHFILRADSQNKVTSGRGRNSIRTQSNNQYRDGVMAFNVHHMPRGCGTWPAIWTVGADWPKNGEIDILEGVNDQAPDQITLHTNSGCSMPASRQQSGNAVQNNCDVAATGNQGCGVKVSDNKSYGRDFNSNDGGWFAVERTNSFIKVWFWSRDDGNTPSDVKNGSGSVDTDSWGTLSAYFPSDSCDLSSKFGPHNIVINLTFCGDWAGSVYSSSGCPRSCDNYVNNNPSAFNDAYFDIQWIKIYA